MNFVEKKRNLKEIKSSMEVIAKFYIKDSELKETFESVDMTEILIASEAILVKKEQKGFDKSLINENIFCKIEVSQGTKCERCWKISVEKSPESQICKRCEEVLNDI